jgi:hypothetical protein
MVIGATIHWVSFFLYSIGNSHTWDFRPSSDFLKMADVLGVDIKNGWHINCGQNLENIWDKPGQTCVELSEYGVYRDAIENQEWDAITLQTFTGDTGKGEKEAVGKILDLINSSINWDCNVFIYCTWPKNTAEKLGDFNYAKVWHRDYHANDTLGLLSEKYFNYLENSIGKSSDKVKFIPVGRVLYHFESYRISDQWPSDRELTSRQKVVIREIISEVLDF